MLQELFLFIIVVATANVRVLGLSCRGCNPELCQAPTGCNYGVVKDVCYCCDVCAKGRGEECGGLWNIRGICGDDFICDKTESRQKDPDYPDDFLPGVCVEISTNEVDSVRSRRAMGRGLSRGRAGSAKLQATEHIHTAYGQTPDHIRALLEEYLRRQSQG